jgi:hypothetical protein
MKKILLCILAIVLLFSLVCSSVYAAVRVKGYFKKNGTYVAPHYRSNPDGIKSNNWSYPGNVNPYTGKVAPGGTHKYTLPDKQQSTPPSTFTIPDTNKNASNYNSNNATQNNNTSPDISKPKEEIPKNNSKQENNSGANLNTTTTPNDKGNKNYTGYYLGGAGILAFIIIKALKRH